MQQRSLQSTVLGEPRAYVVHLPDSYARTPQQRYPVVYVLDGMSQSTHTAATAEVMARIRKVCGDDFIVGSYGADWLYGGSGQDLVIAGRLFYLNLPSSVYSIQAEWTSGRSYSPPPRSALKP